MSAVILLLGIYVNDKPVFDSALQAKVKAWRLVDQLTDCCLQYWGGMGDTAEVDVTR